MTLRLRIVVGLMVGMAIARASAAQAGEGVMSDAEVESVRDANYVPAECIAAYEKILNTREKEIEELLAKPRHAGREQDLHDLMEHTTRRLKDMMHLASGDNRPKLQATLERLKVEQAAMLNEVFSE